MSIALPSNKECSRCIFEPSNSRDRAAGIFFGKLREHSKLHALLESDSEDEFKTKFHERFWELYLPAALDRSGIQLKREQGPLPDFSYQDGDTTIFIEAIACGEPESQNLVPLQASFEDSDFEGGGILPEERVMPRLASVVDKKIGKITRRHTHENMNARGKYSIVIAINGRRAFQDWSHGDMGMSAVPLIARMVFGLPNECRTQWRTLTWPLIREISRKDAPLKIGHFHEPTWPVKDEKTKEMRSADLSHVAGILYSQCSVWEPAQPLGADFIFVENPHGPAAPPSLMKAMREQWGRISITPDTYRPINRKST